MADVFDAMRGSSAHLGSPLVGPRAVDKVAFVGDTHGASDVSRAVFEKYWDQVELVVFLGDYVDRGPDGVGNVECIAARHAENPEKVIVLRGNHETPGPHERYGFHKEVEEKVGADHYLEFLDYFSKLPYAALVNNYLCVHGGIAIGLESVEQIGKLPMPERDPVDPIPFQVLWNDPREMLDGFVPNIRGDGTYYFGADVAQKFLTENKLDGIIRAHEVSDGFRWDLDGKIVTVFSSRYHSGRAGVLLMENGKFREEYI